MCSFWYADPRCFSTVLCVIKSARAISRFDLLLAASAAISRSRGESDSAACAAYFIDLVAFAGHGFAGAGTGGVIQIVPGKFVSNRC
jgi:hypothetical protein